MAEPGDGAGWALFGPGELPVRTVGGAIRFWDSVGSTNDLLKDAARAGADEGLAFVTDEQVAGRGRRGRAWAAPPGTSLLVSTLLRPTWLQPSDAFLLTILAAVAAAEALATTGLPIDVKWPNDLLIRGRKLGGILVEAELDAEQLRWAIVGCGINCNWDPAAIPELAATATSLSRELGGPVARRPLLAALLQRLDQRYAELRRGARSELFAAWRARLTTLGQPVRADTPQGVIEGMAEDVAADGSLIIRDNTGKRHAVTAGDVSIRPR